MSKIGLTLLGMATVVCWAAATPAEEPSAHATPVIEIWKAPRRMELRRGDQLVREFRVALGGDPRSGKEIRGDRRTPVGRYYVSDKNPQSRFHRFIGISYPNLADAERGYDLQRINPNEWADIFFANLRGGVPPSETALGGRVGIHGYGSIPFLPVIDWTEGCIAVSDEEVDFLFDHVAIGTPVLIHESDDGSVSGTDLRLSAE